MATSKQSALTLRQLHHGSAPLVLPTAWDVWSARQIAAADFNALTIGSHPVADALGYQDGEDMSIQALLEVTARITAAVSIPVSVDVESGYDLEPKKLVAAVIASGAAGINVEDTLHSEGRLRSPEEHADYIRRIRAAAQEHGVALVINARTDIFTHDGDPAELLEQGLHRLALLEQAGADSLYPVKLPDTETLTRILAAVSTPVNVTAHPVRGALPEGLSLAELSSLGVRRVSFGPLLQATLSDHIAELLSPWATAESSVNGRG